MNAITNTVGKYTKAIVIAVVIVAALIAQANGIDVGLDVEGFWEQVGAVAVPTFLVWLFPNRPAVRS